MFPFFADAEEKYNLVLAGGALKTCSSFLPHNCNKDVFFSSAKNQDLYEITAESHARFHNALSEWKKNSVVISRLHSALEHIYAEGKVAAVSKNAFFDALNAQGITNDELRHLPDYVYFALLDTHEVNQTDEKGARLTEKVSIEGTTNPHSRRIYAAFVEQARLRADSGVPTILVVTASARDPFSVADFYTGIFTDLGADTHWLPVSAAFQHAAFTLPQSGNGCDALATIRKRFNVFDRERLYPQRAKQQQTLCKNPDRLLALLDKAHGIFFNGGDQSKTLAALLRPDGSSSVLLDRICSRVAEGTLVVGGTSAGTAFQGGGVNEHKPVPMLTSGDPENAMSRGIFYLDAPSQRCEGKRCENGLKPGDITLKSTGGTGLFSHGIIDTHFSERDRETRLVMTTLLSGQSLGFGVDETTALMVGKKDSDTALFRVVGERGVFVADLTEHEWLDQQTRKAFVRQVAGHAHYWASGTVATLRNGEWQIALRGESLTKAIPIKSDYEGKWRSEVSYKCGSDNVISWTQFGNQYVLKASDQTRFSASEMHCSYQQLPFVIRYEVNRN
ncbi:cyanophycinase [Alteromonas sp. H39]|uniref:cyanophycinase n=1 Tax=Alteromonas sp. H39 TaxID=3389876 RepID=UPI0039E01AE9